MTNLPGHLLPALLIASLFAGCKAAAPSPEAARERNTGDKAAWKARAEAKIERHRKGDFTVAIVDAEGRPLRDVAIDYELDRHHFLFGTAVTGDPADPDSETERRYREFILEHFNALVCENAMKWYSVEKEPGEITFDYADRLMAFAEEHDLAMRGHTLFWAKPHWVQDWIHELDDDELSEAIDTHLERMVERYKSRLIAWDVANEILTGHFFRDRLGEEIHAHMFKRAHEIDPDVELHVNEYSILSNERKTTQYIEMIKRMKDQGAPIHGIGIQEHAAQRFIDPGRADEVHNPLIPQEVWEGLDRLAETFPDLPLHLTEISAQTEDQQRRAESLEMLFYIGFAHPQVESILLWGFWEGRHFRGAEAALVDREWNLLPAGERISRLLTEVWHTAGSTRTDHEANAGFRGFYGTYRITATGPDGQPLEGTITLSPDKTDAELTLQATSS